MLSLVQSIGPDTHAKRKDRIEPFVDEKDRASRH